MRKIAKLIVIHVFFLFIFLFLYSPFVYAQEGRMKHVLVLNSYQKGFLWTDEIVKGIESVFEPGKNNVKLTVEYMDTKTIDYETEYKKQLYDLYKYKYRNRKFDLIISSDDNALNFLREYHNVFFPEVPIVFCGVNNLDVPNFIDREVFTGIIELLSVKETIDLALRLHPETGQIVFVVENTPTGNYLWNQIQGLFKYYENIRMTRIDDSFSLEQIEDKVSRLSDDTIVYWGTLHSDKSGKYYSFGDGALRVSRASSRPMYGHTVQILPYGVVGGKLFGGYYHGQVTAKMAQRILMGEKVRDINVLTKPQTRYMFNYEQLKRWGIRVSDLPKDSIVVNKPYSFYEENMWLIGGIIVVVVFQTLIIIGLVVYRLKRKHAEEALIQTKDQYRMVAEQAGQMIYDYNIQTGRISWSGDVPTITGFTVHEFQKRGISGWEKLIHPDDRKAALEMLDEAISKCSNYQVEYRFKHKDGTYIYVGDSGLFLTDKNGNAHQMLGIMKDITERKQAEEALKESEEQLTLLINSIPDLICFKDNMGRWVKANDAILEVFALKGKSWQMKTDLKLSDITDPVYKEAFLVCDKSDKKTWESGHIQIEEESISTLDGKVQIFDMLKIPIYDQDKKKRALIVFGRNITKTKSLESKLRKHKDHLEELVRERTAELQKTINLMAGREVRMAELKEVIKKLHGQVESAGMAPVADDPLKKI